MKMKKLANKVFCGKGGAMLAALALVVTTVSANSIRYYGDWSYNGESWS